MKEHIVSVRLSDLVRAFGIQWRYGYAYHAVETLSKEYGKEMESMPHALDDGDSSEEGKEFLDNIIRPILKAKPRKDGTIKIPG